MKRNESSRPPSRPAAPSLAALARAAIAAAAALALPGCAQPKVFHTLEKGMFIYPDQLPKQPTILAFLSADDRRCDKEIPSLWSITKRDRQRPVVIGVFVYADASFINQIDTIDRIDFPVILDPDRELAGRYGVKRYPTYVFLDWKGREVERAEAIAQVSRWVDEPAAYSRALPKASDMKPAE